MKINGSIKIILLMTLFMSLIGFSSAWSYDSTYSYGDALSYVKVIGTYPICSGQSYSGGTYCVGDYIIDYTITGDYNEYSSYAYVYKYLGYSLTSFPISTKSGFSGISRASCPDTNTDSTCSGDDVKLPVKNGHPKGYILCGLHYDEAENGDWAWTSKCGGYLIDVFSELNVVACYQDSNCGSGSYCDKTGSSVNWQCKQKVCNAGETKCEGNTLYECGTNAWVSKGNILGKCGVDCLSGEEKCSGNNLLQCENFIFADKGTILNKCDVECVVNNDCGTNTIIGNTCKGNNIVQISEINTCSNSVCSITEEDLVIEECQYGCGDSICLEKKSNLPLIIALSIIGVFIFLIIIIAIVRRKK